MNSNLELEIDLVSNSLVHESVFLKPTYFSEVKTRLSINKIWKTKKNNYDLIVGVGITRLIKLYYWAISSKKKASISKTELKKYRNLGEIDFETQVAEIILKKVNGVEVFSKKTCNIINIDHLNHLETLYGDFYKHKSQRGLLVNCLLKKKKYILRKK